MKTCNSWLKSLQSGGMAPNTIHHYMLNARSFLKHMKATPPELSKLYTKVLNGLVAFFDSMLKSNNKPLVQHRHEVKSAKGS